MMYGPPGPQLEAGAEVPEAPPPRDASADVRKDAPGVDAAPWTGEVPIPGEWLAIPGLPDSCGARIAKDARASASRLPWTPCASGRSGCEMFLADWGVDNQFRFRPAFLNEAFEDAAGVHLTYRRSFSSTAPYSQVVTQLLHGEAEASWFSAPGCPLHANASVHGVALAIPHTSVKRQFLGWSSLARPLGLETAEATLTPKLDLSQAVARGADFLTLESTNFGGPIISSAWRFGSRDFARATPTNDLLTEHPLPVPGGYFSLVYDAPPFAAFMPLEGGYRSVVRPALGYSVDGLQLDRANGDALVWSEVDDTIEQQHVIWTAPFATSEGSLVRRRVARLTYGYTFVANAGTAVFVRGLNSARIVRLSDGMGWDFQGEPGVNFFYPIWVNDDSVWVLVSKPDPVATTVPIFSGAIRIKRSTLGPPTVPSGL